MFRGGLGQWESQEELCKRGGGRKGEEPDVACVKGKAENAEVSGYVIADCAAVCDFMVSGRRWWLMYRCHCMRLMFKRNTSALLMWISRTWRFSGSFRAKAIKSTKNRSCDGHRRLSLSLEKIQCVFWLLF